MLAQSCTPPNGGVLLFLWDEGLQKRIVGEQRLAEGRKETAGAGPLRGRPPFTLGYNPCKAYQAER